MQVQGELISGINRQADIYVLDIHPCIQYSSVYYFICKTNFVKWLLFLFVNRRRRRILIIVLLINRNNNPFIVTCFVFWIPVTTRKMEASKSLKKYIALYIPEIWIKEHLALSSNGYECRNGGTYVNPIVETLAAIHPEMLQRSLAR